MPVFEPSDTFPVSLIAPSAIVIFPVERVIPPAPTLSALLLTLSVFVPAPSIVKEFRELLSTLRLRVFAPLPRPKTTSSPAAGTPVGVQFPGALQALLFAPVQVLVAMVDFRQLTKQF